MAQLPFPVFDADNHYYEALFARHIEPSMARRCMQWAVINGKTRLLVGGRVSRFIPNPTFDPVARPGCLGEYFRGNNREGADMRTLFGALEPIAPAYRDREARLALMDRQGLESCFLFPTLGVGMEEALERDARLICMRAGPVPCADRSRSPADPYFDPYWARLNEAGVTVVFHGGDYGYGRYIAEWGESGQTEVFRHAPLSSILGSHASFDTMAALVCHGLFARFPNLRVASIEMGSNWVPWLLQTFRRSYGQDPRSFVENPIDTFWRHIWVSPFHEDDVGLLKELLGAERLLMGSDYPHAEGLANPLDLLRDLEGFSDDELRLVMREKALGLSQRRPASAA